MTDVKARMGSPVRASGADEAPPFAQLVADTSRDLYRLALRLTGDHADAEDVLQNTYANAFQAMRRQSFRGDSELKTWLYRIVVNVAFDERRAGLRRMQLVTGAARLAPHAVDPPALHELRQALGVLPDDQRSALALKELHGLTGREVAAVLERTEGAVEQLLFRARATLKARFGS